MELEPLLCKQCGAPLHGGECDYCGVEYAGRKTPAVDFRSMTNEEFLKFQRDHNMIDRPAADVKALPNIDASRYIKHDRLTISTIREAVVWLKKANISMINSLPDGTARHPHYICICHPGEAYDLQSEACWQNVSRYYDAEKLYSGEIGRIFGVVFVESEVEARNGWRIGGAPNATIEEIFPNATDADRLEILKRVSNGSKTLDQIKINGKLVIIPDDMRNAVGAMTPIPQQMEFLGGAKITTFSIIVADISRFFAKLKKDWRRHNAD